MTWRAGRGRFWVMRDNKMQDEIDARLDALQARMDRIGVFLETMTQAERDVADELALCEPARGNA